MVQILTPIWQRVLQRPSIGVDDNFFSAGGGLRSADMLFAEIAQRCGRELPSATIYHAQTIAALASLLEQPALPRFSPFVQVKTGCEGPATIIVHGLAGTVPFFGLAQQTRTLHPIYGIQAPGVDGIEKPLDSIEDMATLYLDSIKDLQPRGPYILIGYSFGGLVALEMAQRVTERGEKVALLVLIDAYPHPRYLKPVQRLLLMARRITRIVSGTKQRLKRAVAYVARGVERCWKFAGINSTGNRLPEVSRLSFEQTTLHVKGKAYVALARYRPRFYGGKIKFVKSEADSYYPADPVAVWGDLAAQFECEKVPGGHLDMLATDSGALAAVLTRYVQEALGQKFTQE